MLIHCFVITIPEPRALGECRISAFVERSRLGQDDPDNPGHFGGKCDDSFVRVHSGLETIQPTSQAISCAVEMSKAGSSSMNEELANITVSPLADAEELLLPAG